MQKKYIYLIMYNQICFYIPSEISNPDPYKAKDPDALLHSCGTNTQMHFKNIFIQHWPVTIIQS